MRPSLAPIWRRTAALAACAILSASLAAGCQRQESRPSTGVDMEVDEQEQVQAGQKLASLGPAATPEQRTLYEGEFTASGGLGVGAGEGAWELRLTSDYAEFSRPGLGEDGGVAGSRDYRAQGMRVTAGPLVVTIRAQDCPLPDGQSLPYVAPVLLQ